jgi:hypothetical protein
MNIKPPRISAQSGNTDSRPNTVPRIPVEPTGEVMKRAIKADGKTVHNIALNDLDSVFNALFVACGADQQLIHALDAAYLYMVDEAQDHAFVRHHGGLIHTTASHTEARHRFRIVFLLDEAIETAGDWANALFGLAILLGSDRSATDAARLFYGNSRAEIFHIGKTMAPDIVANLIASGRDARASRLPLDNGPWPVDSVRRIAGPELIKVAGGQQVRMDEIGVGTRVHCPHHEDDDPSAFAVPSRAGQIGIHCSACKVTFWSSAGGDDYDFKSFDRITSKEAEQREFNARDSRFYTSKEEIKELVSNLQKPPTGELYKVRAQIASRLKVLVQTLLVAPLGEQPKMRGSIEQLRTTAVDHAGDVIDYMEQLAAQTDQSRRYFVVGFRDAAMRAVFPVYGDPLRFEQQVVVSEEWGLEVLEPDVAAGQVFVRRI